MQMMPPGVLSCVAPGLESDQRGGAAHASALSASNHEPERSALGHSGSVRPAIVHGLAFAIPVRGSPASSGNDAWRERVPMWYGTVRTS